MGFWSGYGSNVREETGRLSKIRGISLHFKTILRDSIEYLRFKQFTVNLDYLEKSFIIHIELCRVDLA